MNTIKEMQIVRIVVRVLGLVGLMYICRHWYHYGHKHSLLYGEHRGEFFFEIGLAIFGIYMAIGAPGLIQLFVPKNDEDEKD
jgi:hypothetical protein